MVSNLLSKLIFVFTSFNSVTTCLKYFFQEAAAARGAFASSTCSSIAGLSSCSGAGGGSYPRVMQMGSGSGLSAAAFSRASSHPDLIKRRKVARIFATRFPQYFAVITRSRQDVVKAGPAPTTIASSVDNDTSLNIKAK